MERLRDIAERTTLITFDCYGTLIDWNGGIRTVLQRIIQDCAAAGRVDLDEMLSAYVATEAGVEARAWQPYRRVQAETLVRLAEQFHLQLLPQHRDLLATTLPDWMPFEDTGPALVRLRERFRLGVLSNIDRDLFARTERHFPVSFDLLVTAEDVGAYKPAQAHFLRALEYVAGETAAVESAAGEEKGVRSLSSGEVPRSNRENSAADHHRSPEWLLTPFSGMLHVAESAYHDGIPTGQLGIPWVWINRTRSPNRHGTTPVAEFADLASFVAVIEKRGQEP